VAIEPGQQLIHYRMTEKIGEGGMGVVWKALDTTLDREVAIKVLPDAFSKDTERLARFEREAKSLASLNHPNIAAIHSVHEAEGIRFLAMELVPGIDLCQRIAAGPVPIDEALQITSRIATALQAAHDGGIVHRDLKPANVKLTPDRKVKVLDFGLAKAWVSDPATGQADPSMSPTMTSAGSMIGTILGTASYMSPEQARGLVVDQRADLWALGVILFEMLAGKQTFPGEDVSEVLAGVIKSDPDWDALPSDLPRSADLVLRRCLTRDVEERLHSAADARILLQEARREYADESEAIPPVTGRRLLLPWGLLCVTVIGALLGLWWLSGDGSTVSGEPVRFRIEPPDGVAYKRSDVPFFDLTPDGRAIVYAAVDSQGARQLYVRDLDSLDSKPLAGTEGAQGPFISEDGVIGFVAQSEFRATRRGDLASWAICEAGEAFYGASFAQDGSMIFSDDYDTGLKRVSGPGGTVETLTSPNRQSGETSHSDPYVLPSGKGVIFTIGFAVGKVGSTGTHMRTRQTAVLSFATGKVSLLLSDSYGPYNYVSDGYLLMLRAKRLIALPFDDRTLEPRGEPFKFFGDEEIVVTEYATAPEGTLAFTDVTWTEHAGVFWVDRQGGETPITQEAGSWVYPSLSPDGRQIVLTHDNQTWILELSGGRRMRVTQRGTSYVPLFSPDGRRVVFGSYQPIENLYGMASDGSGAMELLLDADSRQYPLDWHEPSDTIVLQWTDLENGYGIWTLPAGAPAAEPLLNSPNNERWAQLSPDGRWLAYTSDESGRYEIYVVSYPDARGKRAVSTDGGIEPRWSPRGDELFFLAGGGVETYRTHTKMMAVPVIVESGTLEVGTPRLLFEGDYVSGQCCGLGYDVAEDGTRFVMVKGKPESKRLSVELHAFDRLRRPR
jgi:serine/threonine protein kinase/dipeptidyl aminopeptidase/acylaminoacyl peptidase